MLAAARGGRAAGLRVLPRRAAPFRECANSSWPLAPMPAEQFAFMREVISAPSPVGLEVLAIVVGDTVHLHCTPPQLQPNPSQPPLTHPPTPVPFWSVCQSVRERVSAN